MEGNYGPKQRDILESEQMREWNEWIKSDDPSAIIERNLREKQQQMFVLKEQKEQLDYQKFIEDNPEIVQRCNEMAMQNVKAITEKFLWAEFKSNKLKILIKEKYNKL